MLDVVARTAERCFMPLTVGGGVRTVDDVRALLNAGADKVSINTAAVERSRARAARRPERFGAQCIVVAIDARRRVAGRPDARLGGLHARRPHADRARRGRVGGAHGSRRRRRDPAHQHGPRRHAGGLRPRADARGRRRVASR